MSRTRTRRFNPPGFLERLASAKAASGLTTQQLADKAGLRYWDVNRFLTGAFTGDFDAYERFCDALGVSWQWVICGTEPESTTRTDTIPPAAHLTHLIRQLNETIRQLNADAQLSLIQSLTGIIEMTARLAPREVPTTTSRRKTRALASP